MCKMITFISNRKGAKSTGQTINEATKISVQVIVDSSGISSGRIKSKSALTTTIVLDYESYKKAVRNTIAQKILATNRFEKFIVIVGNQKLYENEIHGQEHIVDRFVTMGEFLKDPAKYI